ncbi:MAG: hypothetical protein ACSHYA_06870 [Opitutaceae bacterium]
MIKKTSIALLCSSVSFSLFAQEKVQEESSQLSSGVLYSRLALSHQNADDYHSGYGSAASGIFENNSGEYTFTNYTVDLAYILPNGLYFGTGIHASEAEVKTTLGVSNLNSSIELREIPLALGYNMKAEDWRLRFEARYIINVDDDFNAPADAAVILPATDGSDSLSFSFRAKRNFAGLEHTFLLGYQTYESDVKHPLFPSFSLGDRYLFDYEVAKIMGDLRLSLGHLISISEQTKGTPGFGGFAYLTEKPRFSELRLTANYRITPRFILDAGVRYYYDGKDTPKQETAYLGLAYIF